MHREHDAACPPPRTCPQCGDPPSPDSSEKNAPVSNLHIPIRPPGPEAKRGTWAFGRLPGWPASSSGLCRCGPAARCWGKYGRDPPSARLPDSPRPRAPPGGLRMHILSCGPLASFQNYFQLQEHFLMPSGVLISRSVLPYQVLPGVLRKAAEETPGAQEQAGPRGPGQRMPGSCRLSGTPATEGLLSARLPPLIFPLEKNERKQTLTAPEVFALRTKAEDSLA